MASFPPNSTLSKSKFLNWIKAALAVLITKEEIEPVVYNEMKLFQQRSLQDIFKDNSLPPGSTCSKCCTGNVVVCPTNRICNINHGKCQYHRNATTRYRPSGCPNGICHHLKSKIQDAHRYQGPSYRNTDAAQWCSSPWEIAKCYMPPDGYEDVQSSSETDFNGIISVIINCIAFEAKITDDLSKKNNVFDKGKEVGKTVRHSPNLEVEDADLTQNFTILNNMLNDTGFISINKYPHNGSQKLAQLESDDLVIGKNIVTKVLADAAKEIQEQIRNETNEFKIETEKQKLSLINIVDTKVRDIEAQDNVSVTKLHETIKSSIDAFEKMVQEYSKKIEQQVREGKQTLEHAVSEGVEDVTKVKENAIQEINQEKENTSTQTEEEKYQELKKYLKDDLIEFYRLRHSKVQLSPIFEENDTPLATFYIRPNINENTSGKKDGMHQIKSLSDMFQSGSKDSREIYLTADAGLGKTTFSKYLAISWCQAHCPEKIDSTSFEIDDIEYMNKFEFVFLVLLRDSQKLCSIEDLIFELIISTLGHSQKFDQDFLQEILNREKSLTILDGLDEWTHPEKPCNRSPLSIPHRNVHKTCTVLTTIRPWKLGVLDLSSNYLGKQVALTKLSNDSAVTLTRRTIQILKSLPDEESSKNEAYTLLKKINARKNVGLASVPLLLMYIICLWCDDIPIGKSKCELYINIVEFLLSRTPAKHGELQSAHEPSPDFILEYFTAHDLCSKYFSLLMNLGKLAYHTLFNEQRENTLVFDRKSAVKYLKADDITFSLLSGILTENTTKTLTKKISKFSFSHKTVQEFFAAIFISSQSDGQKIVVEKCKNVQSILDMSMICEFLSKMNSEMMCEISADLISVINEDEETRKYRTLTDRYMNSKPLYNIQKMLLSCSQEMTGSENIKLCLQDFFIECRTIHDKHLQRLLKLNTINIKSLYYDGVYDEDLSLFLSPSLQTVRLMFARWANYEGNLYEKLDTLKNVQYLYIKSIRLSHEILEIFYSFISGNKSIKQLSLDTLLCIKHRRGCKMFLNLSENSELRNVDLSYINHLDKSSLLLSCDMLNVERVVLYNIEISGESLQNMVENMEKISHLVTVVMFDIEPEKEYKLVRNYIRRSETFVVTRDEDWWFEFQTRKLSKE